MVATRSALRWAAIALLSTVVCAAAEPKKITVELLAVELHGDDVRGMDAGKLVDSLESLVAAKKVVVVAQPRVTTPEGISARVSLTQGVLYVEPAGADTFRLKKLTGDQGAGVLFDVTPTVEKDGRIRVKYSFASRSISGRAPLKGAEGLDVGMPMFSTRKTKNLLTVEDARPMLAGGMRNSNGPDFLTIITARLESR